LVELFLSEKAIAKPTTPKIIFKKPYHSAPELHNKDGIKVVIPKIIITNDNSLRKVLDIFLH